MNEEAIKALRELLEREKALRAQGYELTEEERDAFLRQATGDQFTWQAAKEFLGQIDTGINARNLGRSFVQGALMNFGDELVGIVSPRAKEEMRLREELFREQHPVADAVAGGAGGLATTIGMPASVGVRGATGLGSLAMRGAAAGAAAGALSSLGAGEGNVVQRAPGAAIGGAGGAALGGALPVAGRAVSAVGRPAERAARRVTHAIDRSGGVDAVRANAREMVRAKRGDEMILADLSPRLRAEADFMANASDDRLMELADLVGRRQDEASVRLLNDTRELLGALPSAAARRDELQAARRAWAASDEGFAGLRARNPQLPFIAGQKGVRAPMDGFRQILAQPRVRDAWAEARRTGLIGDFPDLANPSFQKIQDVKEALDDAIDAAYRQGRGNLATRLGEARDRLVEELDARVPDYRSTLAQYHERMNLERALDLGEQAWNQRDPQALRAMVSRMSDDEKHELRIGMASKLTELLANAQTNRDMAGYLLRSSAALREKLKIVFPNEAMLSEYLRRITAEAELAKMRGPISGSQTARRLMAQGFDPAELGLDAALNPAGVSNFLTSLMARTARGAMTRNTANQMGPMLMAQGERPVDRVLEQLMRQRQGVRGLPWEMGAAGAAATGLLDTVGRSR